MMNHLLCVVSYTDDAAAFTKFEVISIQFHEFDSVAVAEEKIFV